MKQKGFFHKDILKVIFIISIIILFIYNIFSAQEILAISHNSTVAFVANDPPDIRIFPTSLTFNQSSLSEQGSFSNNEGSKIDMVQENEPNDDLEKVIDLEILNRLEQGGGSVDVIVFLKGYKDFEGKVRADEPAQMSATQSEIQSLQGIVLNQLDPSQFELRHRFENILGFYGRVTIEGILALVSMPEVDLIEEDKKVEAHLAQGIPLMNASTVRSTYTGSGVSIAIVDTGIDYTHSMLGGGTFPNAKVIGGYDFGDSDTDPLDCQGHGTSVAGIAAGTQTAGPGDYIGGVAHNAKLYALKIAPGCTGSAFTSTIAAAWDWAVSHKNDDPSNPILIINTSFGGGFYATICDGSQPTLATAATNAVNNGITVFASSGNDGYCAAMGSPACVSDVISVGAVYDANIGSRSGFCISSLSCTGYNEPGCWFVDNWACDDISTNADQATCYSDSANFLNLLAPSNNAYTTAVGGSYTSAFGGTSAASPYAAGAATILQSYAMSTTGSYYTPNEIKTKLVNSGDPITDPKSGITTPRVNVGNAIGGSSPSHTLSVSTIGSGTVTSVPTGINCGVDCTEDYLEGTQVALTATPAGGWSFSGWSGACSGTETCQVTLNASESVIATFYYTLNETIGVIRNGKWYLDEDGNNFWSGCVTDGCYIFGTTGDYPAIGDWHGLDGNDEMGVFRNGKWYKDANDNGFWDGCVTDRCATFGTAGDIPVVGDFNGDNLDDIGVFRNGKWYIDINNNAFWDGCGTDLCTTFGTAGDIPVVGDWGGGSSHDEIGVFRNGKWYLDLNGDHFWSGCITDGCYTFGTAGDKPAVGNWSPDGDDELGVFRDGMWYLDLNDSGVWDGCTSDGCYIFGTSGDTPAIGLW